MKLKKRSRYSTTTVLDSAGTLGGVANVVDNLIYSIPVDPGDDGINYWFGEGRIRDEFISKRLFLSSSMIDEAMGDGQNWI